MGSCLFELPGGATICELDVVLPDGTRVRVPASLAQEMHEWREDLHESMRKQGWTSYGTLAEELRSCLSGYERIAENALAGASSVRDDMVTMLRSVVLVLETVGVDYLNHFQKNERIRGVMAVLERHIHSLREERFSFRDSLWRRERDLFSWREPERRLREKIDELEAQLAEFRKQHGIEEPQANPPD